MDFDEQLELGHLLLNDRRCKSCGEVKNLVDDFYRTRKDRGAVPSSYSYVCRECFIEYVKERKKDRTPKSKWEYPDW
tara:strand:+ start:1712 stop:1942 length:231 start_codon:yes stop_codon:yes gene_type:complete